MKHKPSIRHPKIPWDFQNKEIVCWKHVSWSAKLGCALHHVTPTCRKKLHKRLSTANSPYLYFRSTNWPNLSNFNFCRWSTNRIDVTLKNLQNHLGEIKIWGFVSTQWTYVTFTLNAQNPAKISLNRRIIPQQNKVKYLDMPLYRRRTWTKHEETN